MPGPEFFQTGMGKRFYESHVPALVTHLGRIADMLERAGQTEVRVGAPSDDEVDYAAERLLGVLDAAKQVQTWRNVDGVVTSARGRAAFAALDKALEGHTGAST